MNPRSLSFIGGGRVARILMGGFERAGRRPTGTPIVDPDDKALAALSSRYPDILACRGLALAASQQVVFGALHPSALRAMLPELGSLLRPDAIFVSLAPRITIHDLIAGLGGFRRVARMIPNAPSIIGEGFNPVAISADLTGGELCELLDLLGALGECPVVEEPLLEAYAVVSGMGPTYLWFQLQELADLGVSFGLTPESAARAVRKTAEGAAAVLFSGVMPPDEVMDLVPIHPLRNGEQDIRRLYRTELGAMFGKLAGGSRRATDEAEARPSSVSSTSSSGPKELSR